MSGQPEPGTVATREQRTREEPHARVFLVRHGEPDWAPAGGPSVNDPRLTPFGIAQARTTAQRLAGEDLDAIYVSPLRRSQETAAPLSEVTGIEPVTVDGLAEVGVAVEGMSPEQVDRYFVQGTRRPLEQHWEGWPGAETFLDFHARVTRAVTEVLARHAMHPLASNGHDFTEWELPARKPCIAIVAHCGTNAVALTHLLDVRPVPWEWLRFESELAAFSVLQARPLGPTGYVWSLQNFNELDHLRAARLR